MQRPSSVPTPITPIPRRASASSPGVVRAQRRHPRIYIDTGFREEDVTRLPTIPRSATWEDEDGRENSYALLPMLEPAFSPFLPSSPSIDELDTVPPNDFCKLATNPPPPTLRPHSDLMFHDEPASIDDVVEADTVMDDTLTVTPSLPIPIEKYATRVEDVVDVALAVRARELLRRKGSRENQPAFIHNPLDYIRWWLLYPGRLEFLFWLGGAVLLGVILCVVLVILGLGMGWMSFGHLVH